MGRDKFKCTECGRTTETLHVHHKSYIYGRMPWDYDDSNLVTLCKHCHRLEESLKKENPDHAEYAESAGLTSINVWMFVAMMTYCKIHHPNVHQDVIEKLKEHTLSFPKESEERQRFYNHLSNPRRKTDG